MDAGAMEAAANRAARLPPRRRRQRSDARQSIAAILHAATEVLNADPTASVEDIARAAGVSRQTVYAHFPSREALLGAVIERATEEVVAAFDTAGLDDLPPAAALLRLLDTGWQVAARYPFAWHLPAVGAEEDASRHAPVLDRMLELISRGQDSGDLDATLPPHWLLTAALALGRAAEDEVKAGRMSIEEASHAVRASTLRLLGVTDSVAPAGSTPQGERLRVRPRRHHPGGAGQARPARKRPSA